MIYLISPPMREAALSKELRIVPDSGCVPDQVPRHRVANAAVQATCIRMLLARSGVNLFRFPLIFL